GLIYPTIALGTSFAAVIAENTRAAMAESMSQEYVRVARAKGLRERVVLSRHVLRNGLIPIITVTGLQAGQLLGGTIITETIFALPGLGRLALSAVQLRDYPLMQGIVITIATVVLLANLLADIVYGLADPRVRVG
ncbi:MAG: ABC transporter permease, partial [Chloroflexota bacterium]|nr:ABC transporter permease [Chloroflexota bacterium]